MSVGEGRNGVSAGIRLWGIGHSVSTSFSVEPCTTHTVLVTATLGYDYTSFCTNFDHTAGAATFSGRARLLGSAWSGDGTTSVSIGEAPVVVLTASFATYVTGLSAGMFGMTGSVVDLLYPGYTRVYSSFDVTVTASAQFTTPDSCDGVLQATVAAGSTTIGVGSASLVMTRGGTCPV